MDWKYLFLSTDGRISRQPFWIAAVVLVVINLIAAVLDAVLGLPQLGSGPSAHGPISIIVGLVLIYPSIALSAKRWHDRDKSAWWILINIIPFIGWLWSLIETGFLRGTPGPNRYGADPLGAGAPAAA